MNVIKYNVNSGDVCQIGRQYEYGKTQVIFEGYQVIDSANEIYFKFVGRTEDSKYLVPIIDMSLDITQQLTKHVGQFSCQLEEMNTEGTLVSQSPVFYVAVKRSIKVGADYEVQDSRLETIYQKYNEMYNIISQTNETSLANESQRQAEWLTLKQEVSDAINSFDADTAISEFRTLVQTETYNFNTNAETKFNAYNQNDSQKTTAYNTNATEKLNAYNSNAENKVSEFNAQTEQIQTDISELKSDLSDVENIIFTSSYQSVNVSDIPKIEKYVGYNASAKTNGVEVLELTNYDSYVIVADHNCDIYVDETIPSSEYYAITIGRNYTGKNEYSNGGFLLLSSDSVRYRNSESNLPTESNKLSVNTGDVIVFTFLKGKSFTLDGYVEVKTPKISNSAGYATKTESSFAVTVGKLRAVTNKYNHSNIREAHAWRANNAYIKDTDGNFVRLWYSSDSDGVVKIKDEDDFIGGYHGDGTQTAFRLFIDGVEYVEESAFTDLDFKELGIYCESEI